MFAQSGAARARRGVGHRDRAAAGEQKRMSQYEVERSEHMNARMRASAG